MQRYTRMTVGKYIETSLLRAELNNAWLAGICHEIKYLPDTDYLELWFTAAVDETAMDTVITAHDATKYNDLRIMPYMYDKKWTLIENDDYTIVGLVKASPFLEAWWRKSKAEYFTDVTETTVVVEKAFDDWYEDEDDGQWWTVSVWKGIDITHKWKKNDWTDWMTKTEKKPLNKEERWSMKIRRRQKAVDGLIARAKWTPIEGMVDAIFDHYKNQKDTWIATWSSVLYDAIEAETDPTILWYLAVVVWMPDYVNGWVIETATVKDSIYQQITA